MQAAPQLDGAGAMIVFFGCALFTLLLVFYIFLPVRVDGGAEKTRLEYLYEQKDVIYENLRDLNFEYKAGKLSLADFESVRSSMEEEAAAALAEIDQLENPVAGNGRSTALPGSPKNGSQKSGVRA
jgi:hypothetical protein